MKALKELFNKFEGRFELVKNNIGWYNNFRDEEVYSSLNKLVELTNEAVDKAIDNNDYDNEIFEIRGAVVDIKEAFDKVRYARRRTDKMLKAFESALKYAIKVFNNIIAEDEVVAEEDEIELNEDAIELNKDAIELNKVDKVNFNKSFEVKVNGLAKSYSIKTEEVESQYGYTDLLCKIEATSTIFVDGEYAIIRAYSEVYDGVVISLNIDESREHKQLESFVSLITAKDISKKVNELINSIRYEVNNYVYERDYTFVESVMTMVLNLNSYDSNTCLYNNKTYSLAQIA